RRHVGAIPVVGLVPEAGPTGAGRGGDFGALDRRAVDRGGIVGAAVGSPVEVRVSDGGARGDAVDHERLLGGRNVRSVLAPAGEARTRGRHAAAADGLAEEAVELVVREG